MLVVMTKLPVAGKVKTRLMPALSAEQAAGVHRAFVCHVLGRLHGLCPEAELIVSFDPPGALAAMRELLGARIGLMAQSDGNLGQRLADAYRRLGSRRAVFLGVDSPDVPIEFIRRAIALVHDNDVVTGPCADGGYWTLGLGESVDAESLLVHVEWSSGREQAQTLARARELGYRVAVADAWDDVDRPDDLRRLVQRLRSSHNAQDAQLLRQLEPLLPASLLPPRAQAGVEP
ncbi:TIGR04282 family arsenosugar biosynthesis glycosyltransferase [Fontivita pretiosa]|uniref:TIGR04282 family arsenosugar biosynthesis glycosyltransferase n=1 Tax=Fontivita pretiosa TaxID=2989684 RepID=UPI003D1810FB